MAFCAWPLALSMTLQLTTITCKMVSTGGDSHCALAYIKVMKFQNDDQLPWQGHGISDGISKCGTVP